MIASLTLTSIARKMTKLITPDYFTQNTCLFKDNFLHEMPFDVQISIMGEVEELDKKELERKDEIFDLLIEDLQIVGDDEARDSLSNAYSDILWDLKIAIHDDDDDNDYIQKLKRSVDAHINNQNQLVLEKIVEYIGVMSLIKDVAEKVDITKYTTEELYIKCYYQLLYNHIKIDYTCDDIKIIKKYNLSVLV